MNRTVLIVVLAGLVLAAVYFAWPAKALAAPTVPKAPPLVPPPLQLPDTPNVLISQKTGLPVEVGTGGRGVITTETGAQLAVQSVPLKPGVTSLFQPGRGFTTR